MEVKNIKCHDDGSKLRITFDWPVGVGEVYVNGKLFTLQEYKTRGGFVTEKLRGRMVYYISDNEFEQGCLANSVCFVEKTFVTCKIREIAGLGYDRRYKNHEITLMVDYPVPGDAICYEKNSDGIYHFGEPIMPGEPLVRVIRAMKDEPVRIFVNSEFEELYGIVE